MDDGATLARQTAGVDATGVRMMRRRGSTIMTTTTVLPVIIEQVPGWQEEHDEPQWRIRCPYPTCGTINQFREVDIAIRWNTGEDFKVEDGRIVFAPWSRGQADFKHDKYECEGCDQPVTMEIEDESWD
jgi:hypothetical protein